jgi:DNA-binding SARP family transcriptional activator/pimeloyl-ACP methyl ester carboxylesterase
MIEVRLTGELEVIKEGEPVKLPVSRKTRALLAYLIFCPGLHRRERLCEIFWQVPDNPRGALRWSLSKLRKVVDDDAVKRILADRDSVAFNAEGVEIDILAMRDKVANGISSLGTEELRNLAATASRGLLIGLELSGQPDFEHFVSAERESLRIIHRDLLLELIRRYGKSPAEGIHWYQKLVEIEPYHFEAHYALIEALAKAGRKKDADKQLSASTAMLGDIEGVDLTALRQAAAGKPLLSEGVSLAPDNAAAPGPEQEIRFCKTIDGAQIAYATVGVGPPLVKAANWLNHLDFDWESPVWKHVFRGLSQRSFLIRYDARGNGLSDWDIDDFSLDRQVEDLETVVDAMGLKKFPLLGISQGAAISAVFAARHPESVTKLILVGGYARGWNRVGNPDIARQTEAMITLVGIGWGKDNPAFRQMFTSMFMPDAPPENQSWFNELQRISTTPGNAVKLLRAVGEVDISDILPQVRTPTLVMHARGDMRVSFDMGRELAAGIPGARFVSLNTNNHLMPRSDPAWPVMLREINDFLAGTP